MNRELMNTDKRVFKDIDEYIATFPEDVQIKLEKLRKTIIEAAPQAQETISYQMPTFKLKRNLVHFAAYKKHIGFYPTSSGIENFTEELSTYETSKGAVKFPLDQPIPYNLIGKIVRFRLHEEINRQK